MALKFVMFYNQANRGWTETWYIPGTSEVNVPIDAPPWSTILRAAIGCRWSPTVITACRLSTLDRPILSRTYNLKDKYIAAGGGTNFTLGPEPVAVDAFYSVRALPAYKKGIAIRGLPDDQVFRYPDGTDAPEATLSKNIQTYLTAVYNAGWCIRRIKRIGEAGVLTYPVNSVAQDPLRAGIARITLAATAVFPWAPTLQVQFRGVPKDDLPGFPPVVHPEPATAAPVTRIDIPYRVRANAEVFPAKMTVSSYVYELVPIFTWEFVRFSQRQTGGPFGVLRGRSRAVVRSQ